MTAHEMIQLCSEFETRYKHIASLQDTELMKRDFLYTAQFFGDMKEIIEDHLFNEGRRIDFLFKAFELRDKDWGQDTSAP